MNSIFKTFVLSLLMIAQVHFAYAQNAAILPPAMTTFVDQNGKPLTSGTVDFYIPGTSTRKATWQDADATVLNTNPVVLNAAGRALILGNGSYRQVVKDRNGLIQWDRNTSSAGSGGSRASTVGDGLYVGSIIPWAGLVAPTNYAFPYGQELSRTTYATLKTAITSTQNITCVSGNATVTSVSDTTQLPIGGAVEAACLPANSVIVSKTSNTITLNNLASVSTTSSAVFFPWGAGNGLTTFNLPDLRGVYMPGRNNMGSAASANLSSPYYTDPNSLASSGGTQSKTLLASDMPSHSHSITDPGHTHAENMSAAGGSPQIVVANGSGVISPSGINTGSSTTGITVNATGGGIAVSATVAAGGGGYTPGTQLLTLAGGTCTTQPQFNVTISAGAITAPVLVTAGDCTVVPSNPVTTTGGGGTLGTLNVTWSARPFSLIPPSKTINYVIKITPDVNLSIANCANLLDAGTACTANTGTSGHTLPFLDSANTWSALQNFGSVTITGGSITGMSLPTVASDVANKQYVDNVASGLNVLAQTKYATAAVLPNTPTYANGASGVGATLTAGANSTLTVDGNVVALNEVVLVKNQASAFQNGIYTLTTAGSGAAAWVLTRAAYFDQAAEMKAGSYTFVTNGSTNVSTSYVLQTAVTTVGTDALNWVLFSVAGVSQIDGTQGAITTQSDSLKVVGGQLSSNVLSSRAFAITQDLSGFSSIRTLGYYTAGDGGGGTFQKQAVGTSFIDQNLANSPCTITGGSGYTNGTYYGAALTGGSGVLAFAVITVSGGAIVTVDVTYSPGNKYKVGDALSVSPSSVGGTGSGFVCTVNSLAAAQASFTDAASNPWQFVADNEAFPNTRQFGAKIDGTTDDFASIQSALLFANYSTSPAVGAVTGYWGGRVYQPKGASNLCGTTTVSLVIPQGVRFIGAGNWASTLSVCSTFSTAAHFIELCNPNWRFACFDARLEALNLVADRNQAANANIAMVHSNNVQHTGGLVNVQIQAGYRSCIFYEKGYGGASYVTIEDIECGYNGSNYGIRIGNTTASGMNVSGTVFHMNKMVVGGPSTAPLASQAAFLIQGGLVQITNSHSEQIPQGIIIDSQAASLASTMVKISNYNAGSGSVPCTATVQFNITNTSGNTIMEMIPGGSCANIVLNGMAGGVNYNTNIVQQVKFTPNAVTF